MIDRDLYPTFTPCGSCGASTALSWQYGDPVSTGVGRCPRCGYRVLSLVGDIPLDVFLSAVRGGSASRLQGCRL